MSTEVMPLVSITVEERRCQVPADETVLRALQQLGIDLYACRLCWNGDCDNCRFVFVEPDSGQTLSAKACLTSVTPELQIINLPRNAVWPEPETSEQD